MKAIVKTEAAPGLSLVDVPVPEIGINDVLIRIQKTSICGTDVHIYQWDDWASETIRTPLTVGHEFAGVIDAVGSDVEDFDVGDLVSGEGHIVCGHCRNCRAGRRHLCQTPNAVGINRDGAFAEYLMMPASNVWRVNPAISPEILTMFDPFGNAVHAALSWNLIGEDVLITGAGPIGIMSIMVARHAGARHIVITDMNPYRLALAKECDATIALDVTDGTIAGAQAELGMIEGFDVGLEMSGNPAAVNDMMANMAHGGKISLLGIQNREAAVTWDDVIFKGLTIKGIYGREMYETWYKMTALIQSGLDISPLITHRFHYTEYEKAFEVMASGESGKVILDWTE
ncbi:MAG: L-threonine 3-dehydrogenase [Dehalococcoidia bacterium]|jgi:threonine 3-dehydrogenase|nr:L-threonine 3-dehydrogenase [Dehalococcoidia bacterium]